MRENITIPENLRHFFTPRSRMGTPDLLRRLGEIDAELNKNHKDMSLEQRRKISNDIERILAELGRRALFCGVSISRIEAPVGARSPERESIGKLATGVSTPFGQAENAK